MKEQRLHCKMVERTEATLKAFLDPYPDRKCSVSLLHGDLSEGQMRALYEHDKIKCLVNIAHGEGFGLPLLEAARCALPIIAVPWSGQMDFLRHDDINYFAAVDYKLGHVHADAIWPSVIEKDSQWAYADENSFKMALQLVHEKWDTYKQQASELQGIVNTKFNEEILYAQFCNSIMELVSETQADDRELA